MSVIRAIPKAAVTASLNVVRAPADLVLGAAGDGRVASTASQFVDRADAAARRAAGVLLRDDELKADAHRRRTAAGEHARAARLRAEASDVIEVADEQAERERAEAAKRRREAAQKAERKRKQAQERRKKQKADAAEHERARKRTAEQRAAEQKQEAGEEAKRERAEVLETKVEALEEREDALAAVDEAARLKHATERAKEERKTEAAKTGSSSRTNGGAGS